MVDMIFHARESAKYVDKIVIVLGHWINVFFVRLRISESDCYRAYTVQRLVQGSGLHAGLMLGLEPGNPTLSWATKYNKGG
jgi:hypothetical protein